MDDLMQDFIDHLLVNGKSDDVISLLEPLVCKGQMTCEMWISYGLALNCVNQPLRAHEAFLQARALKPDDRTIDDFLMMCDLDLRTVA